MHSMATAFDGAASVYEQARPGYPVEAVDWLVRALGLGPGRRVLDLAAGTGKLTCALLGSGAQVIGVEPVPAMRATLAARIGAASTVEAGGAPASSVVGGVAQALPVGDGRLDAITVAQGFHWFATEDALAEMHRTLRPGGGLGLIWNRRDQSDPLQAVLTALMEPWRGDTPSHESGAWRHVLEPVDRFAPTGETHLAWRHLVDVGEVADRVASVSFIAAMNGDERARLLDRVRAAASELPAPLALVYNTDVYCFIRMG